MGKLRDEEKKRTCALQNRQLSEINLKCTPRLTGNSGCQLARLPIMTMVPDLFARMYGRTAVVTFNVPKTFVCKIK
jgi:hypothetical protein